MVLRSTIVADASLLRAFSRLEPYGSIMLAVSGGPDSMALMVLARRWLQLTGRNAAAIMVATVDHGLRPESGEEAAFVAAQACNLGFAHATLAWTGEKPKTGVQAEARRARYDLLISHARVGGAAALVTAHTEDDQAETLMMRLARGSGLDGLAAMAPVSHRNGLAIVRPLLGFSKARLTAYLRAASVPFLRDPSNENTAFERVRLRSAMKALASAGIARSSLATTAARLNRSRDALASITEDFLESHFEVAPLGHGKISHAALEAVPADIAIRALSRIFSLISGKEEPPRLVKAEQIFSSLPLRKAKTTFGGCIMIAASGTLYFYREPGRLKAKDTPLEPGGNYIWDGRFVLIYGPAGDRSLEVRQLGATGWLLYKKAIKAEGLPVEPNRLAALTIPALWKGNRLMCVPLLSFSDLEGMQVEAALVPGLARFLTAIPDEDGGLLGKGTLTSYL